MDLHPEAGPGHGALNENPNSSSHLSPYPVLGTFDMADLKVKRTSTTPKKVLPEAPPGAPFLGFFSFCFFWVGKVSQR